MALPVFVPRVVPTLEPMKGVVTVDYSKPPACVACGDVAWSRDEATETCRACWRALVLGAFVAANPEALK